MMPMKKIYCLITVLLLWQSTISAVLANVQFNGNLIDRPCHIKPGSGNQFVTFKVRGDKDFFTPPGRTPSVNFSITLSDCDKETIGKVVNVIFKGTEEAALPGYLAVEGVNKGKLAIGLVDVDGKTLLPINSFSTQGVLINKNELLLPFSAFVQATSDAMTKHDVVPGAYQAIAQFELQYK